MSFKNWILKLFGKAEKSSEKASEQSPEDEKGEEKVPVTGVSIFPALYRVYVGQTFELRAMVKPANATDMSLAWSSNEPSVAVVDSRGVVTALSVGCATINAQSKDGSCSASVTVDVSSK